jgi:hypothetical protein
MKNWRHTEQNLMQTLNDRLLLERLRFGLRSAGKDYSPSAIIPFSILIPVILFLYFDLSTQHWFLQLTGGHLLRIWIPPLVFFAAIFGGRLWKRELPIPLDWQTILIAVYGTASLITLSLNETPFAAGKYWLIMIAPVWMYFVILDSCDGSARIESVLKWLFLGGFLLILYTLFLQGLIVSNPDAIPLEMTTRSGQVIPIAGEAFYKEKGIDYSRGFLLYSCGHYGGILLFPFLFGVFQFFRNGTWLRWSFLAISLIMSSQIINTLSRTDIVAMSVGLIVLWGALAYEGKSSKGQRRFVFLSVFTGLILYTVLFKPFLLGRFLQLLTFLDYEPVNQYIVSMQIVPSHHVTASDPHIVSAISSLQAFIERPLMGWGFSFTEQHLHELNRYLFILVSTGVLTFSAYVFFWAGILLSLGRSLIKARHSSETPTLATYFISCIAMLGIKFAYVGMETFYYWIIGSLAMAWVYTTEKSPALSGRHALQ